MNKVLIAVDISGSISEFQHTQAMSAARMYLRYIGDECELSMVLFDHDVHPVPMDMIPKYLHHYEKVPCGGGTDFEKLLDIASEYDKVLVCTDGFVGVPFETIPENIQLHLLYEEP